MPAPRASDRFRGIVPRKTPTSASASLAPPSAPSPRDAKSQGGRTNPVVVVRRARTPLVLASAFLASFTLPGPAAAYRTAADLPEFDDDATIAWPTREIPYRVHTAMPAGLDRAAALAAIEAAAATWNAVECTDVQLVFAGFTDEPPVAGDDVNTIAFVQTDWTAMGLDADAAATTDVRYASRSDETRIVEADLLLNAEAMAWTTSSPSSPERRDVQAVVTHELGHVLGLLHPCEVGGIDGAPECGPIHEGTSLHPTYFGVLQRRLAADDVDGICSLYPTLPCAGACAEGLECTPGGCRAPCGATHCPRGFVCNDADSCEPQCADGCHVGVLGDPCATDLDCGGSCSDGGFCTVACVAEAERSCPDRWQCTSSDACEPAPNREVLGAACSRATDCAGGLCLFEGERGRCSRTCDSGCPSGFDCVEVENQAVCRTAGADGCSASGATSTGVWLPILLLFAQRRRS